MYLKTSLPSGWRITGSDILAKKTSSLHWQKWILKCCLLLTVMRHKVSGAKEVFVNKQVWGDQEHPAGNTFHTWPRV